METNELMERIINLLAQYGWNILLVVLAIFILVKGIAIIGPQIQKKGIGPYNFKALGLVILLPVVLALGGSGYIEEGVLGTIIGAIAGYIFGIERKPEQAWGA